MKFPIAIKTPNGDSPAEREACRSKIHYLVAQDGVYQVREMPTHRAVTRVTSAIPGLPSLTEQVELRFPLLPREQLEDTVAFFRDVYQHYGGEAIVLLFYSPATREFRIGVPSQRITSYTDYWGRVWPDHRLRYDAMERPNGFVLFGTIHSHADLVAYASHTDCEDERYEDGLHVVFGSFKTGVLTRSASFVANGARFPLEPSDVLEPFEVPDRPCPAEWFSQVEYAEDSYRPYYYSGGEGYGH